MSDESQGRRRLPTLPQNLSLLNWEMARGPLARFLRVLPDVFSGIVGAFRKITPNPIQAGVDASPGTDGASWAAADHTHHIETGPIGSILLGTTAAEGAGAALARASGRNETLQLFAQVRNLVAVAGGV